MGLDIRIPIGMMFAIFGLMLTGYGITSDASIYSRSFGMNVNLWWGLAQFVFGALMLYLGRRGASAMQPAETTPEGRATERREHETGLERPNRTGGH